ncbi:RHS repeat protein [Diaphorobacter sp. HDW4A]|uniref:RHS repeat-associated core domain-containing protein n=1 Tax=Diaphorobacter sp. HDW4A TaxID=2714924 RepID=UPI00140E6457|nr:RHS repeat-associated core domain-containing protein [Diaphorobacter sp. HDW4A]QIL80978.1 RHS repeat protein [Diaphorobacter sp. HDW4A]
MDATVAYFSQGRTNICSVSWSVDGPLEPLTLDPWIESKQLLWGRQPYAIHWLSFDKEKGECVYSKGGVYVYQTRYANCFDPENQEDIAKWSNSWMTDIASNVCVSRNVIRRDSLPQMCSMDGSGNDRNRTGNTFPSLAGNPVQISTGNKIEANTDYFDRQAAPLTFTRIYNSGWSSGVIPTPPEFYGKGWSHNHEAWLTSSRQNVGTNKTSNAISPKNGEHETLYIHSALGEYSIFHRFVPPSTSAIGSEVPGTFNGGAPGQRLERKEKGWEYTNSEDTKFFFNADGRVTKKITSNGDVYAYEYNTGTRKLISIRNQFNRSVLIAENMLTSEVELQPSSGDLVRYSLDDNLLSKVTSVDGSFFKYTYNPDKLLIGKIDEIGNSIGSYTYSDNRVVKSEKSPNTDTYLFNYDHTLGNRITTITPPIGDRITTRAQASGLASTVTTSPFSALNTSTQKGIYLTADGFLDFETDYRDNAIFWQWNKERILPTKITEAKGQKNTERITDISWHLLFRKPIRLERGGNIEEMEYDQRGNMISWSVTGSTGIFQRHEWTYDGQDNLLTVTAPGGYSASYTYDANSNRKTFTDPFGRVTYFTDYDNRGRLLSFTDPTGRTYSLTYDLRGRLTSSTVAGLTTSYQYQLNGVMTKAIFPNGYVVNYTYDTAQRLTGWTDNRGNAQTFVLDGAGNRTSEKTTDSIGSVAFEIARTLNGINRVSSETVGADQKKSFTYDANGDLATISDGLLKTVSLTRDALRRTTAIRDENNAKALLSYNALDAIVQAKDRKSVATDYSRNAIGGALQETSLDTGIISSTFDARGLTTSVKDATGRMINIDNDALGRTTKLSYNDSTTSLLKYDLSGTTYNTTDAPNASIGSLSEVQDPGVTTQYQRDALSRIVRKTQTLSGGETRSTSYTYVPAGQGGAGSLQSITYPSGKTLAYSYDSTGLITGMTWNGTPLVSALQWSPLGVPTVWTWPGIKMSPTDPSSLFENRQYNTAGQLIHSGLLDLTWDAAGRVTAIAQSHMIPGSGSDPAQRGMVSSSFNYNATGNLTASAHALMAVPAVTLPAGVTLPDVVGYTSLGYSYDANANRTSGVFTKATGVGTPLKLTRTYTSTTGTNRLASVTTTSSAGGTIPAKTYEYDASGSLTSAAGQYLHYGPNGRVAKLTGTASSTDPLAVSYVYNSSSQRVLKTDAHTAGAAVSEHAFYSDDDGTSPLGFYSSQRSSNSAAPAGENDSTELLYLPTANGLIPIAAQINGRIYAIDTDHLNTPRRLTNADGQVAWQWLITGFGEVTPTTGATGYLQPGSTATAPSYAPAVTFNLRYPGQQWDQETGLAYNINRYYDASSGRYIQADPIGLDGGWNRFAYVSGNPLNAVDPWGLQTLPRRPQDNMPVGVGGGAGPLIITGAGGAAAGRSLWDLCKQGWNWIFSDGGNNTLEPGPHAGDSIPARGPGRDFTPEERDSINDIGDATGCHTCGSTVPGTNSGNWIPDHQPPNALNPDAGPQRLYPHCLSCSRRQGGQIRGNQTRGN